MNEQSAAPAGPPARSGRPRRVVRAGGGVIWRNGVEGREVVLVHRRVYDDWTFPKGKAERGESYEDAAVREVHEETALVCELGVELRSVSYEDRRGRPKKVRYWEMTPIEGEAKGSNEVDEARWVTIDEARKLLTYDRDHLVLSSFLERDGDATASASQPSV